jgi:hypothetical protein
LTLLLLLDQHVRLVLDTHSAGASTARQVRSEAARSDSDVAILVRVFSKLFLSTSNDRKKECAHFRKDKRPGKL